MDNEKNEIREEVLYILKDAINTLAQDSDGYCTPNGSMWSYEDVIKYVESNLK
jgi:hypothetical protein